MLFHVLATNVKAMDLSTVNVFPLFSSKKLATKTPKIIIPWTEPHTRTRQEGVPEGLNLSFL